MQQLAHNYGGPHANHNCMENKTNRKRQPHTEEDNHNCIEKKHEYKTKPNRKQLCLSVCACVLHFRATTQSLHVSWIKRLLQFVVVVVILVLQF